MERDYGLAPVTIFPVEKALSEEAKISTADFAALVRAHQSMVFSLARHFLRDRSLAEEVAQEAFLRLYQNLASIESSIHLVRWLRKVTWRLCIDEIRRRPAKRPLSLDEIAEPLASWPEPDPLSAGHLRRLVAALPESVRMTVILRYQEDMDLAEIAEVLDAPVNTIKSRLQRVLAILRARLDRNPGGSET